MNNNPMDFEKLQQDKKIMDQLEAGEQVLFSWRVIKYTGQDLPLNRILAVTTHNIYNVEPPDEKNAVVNFFQNLVNKSRVKRKIPLELIESITVSKVTNEFILHVPTEYDQRYKAETQRDTILLVICDAYCKNNFKKLIFRFISELNLIQFTTTNYDLKKSTRRNIPQDGQAMDPDELKKQFDENKSRTRTIYQRKKKQQVAEIGLEDFTLIKVLGRGAFGKVMLCEKKDSKKVFAVKSLRKEDIIAKDQLDYIKTERKILEQIHHPFLVSLEYAFQTDENIFFVMKFMKGGELYTHLQKLNRFNEKMTLFYASQILLALEHLHKFNVIYRDLKPENILMDEKGYIALTDYGLAKILHKGQQAQSIVGTPEYLPPEVIGQQGHCLSADWWCLGVLIYEMVCGRTPFFSENRNQMFKNIREAELKFPPNVQLTKDCKDVIQSLLKKKPSERLGAKNDAEDIKKHPWFKQMNFELLIQKKVEVDYKPEIKDEQDLSNFSQDMLQQDVTEEAQEKNENLLKQFDDEFYGLTYAPNSKLQP